MGCWCALSHAGEPGAAKATGMELYPTYSAVGVELAYTGEDDDLAGASFVWRKAGEDKWRNGVDMTVDHAGKHAWGSIWPLDQGETVEVRASFTPTAGAECETLEGSATVRKFILETSGGSAWFVSPSGDDKGAGSKEAPFKTIARAASAAKAGDMVYCMSGVYREGNLFSGLKGEESRPIVFVAASGEKPVIDGSAVIEKGARWSKVGDNLYSIDFKSPTGQVGYVGQDGLRMYLLRSMNDIADGRVTTEGGDRVDVPRAWYYNVEASKLYVRNADGSAAASHEYNLALHDFGADFAGSAHVVVRGFEIRCFGKAGVGFRGGATGCVAYENVIHNAPAGIVLSDVQSVGNAAWRNEIYERGLLDFSWNAIKASEYSRQGVTHWAGRGTSICHNTIHGFFDGVSPVSWLHPNDLAINRDFDIIGNTIFNIGDDGIEIDGGGVNMRIHGNRLRNCFSAISLAPVERGPVYCVRNDMTYTTLLFKLNVGGCTSKGWAYCYHNSAYCLTKGRAYGGTAISFAPGAALVTANKVFKNNAFICEGLGVRYGRENFTIDYNCYRGVPGGRPPVYRWEVQDQPSGEWERMELPSMSAFSQASGRERHGIEADPEFISTKGLGALERLEFADVGFNDYPQLEDASAGDLRLKDSSPCIDRGALLRGINEDFTGKAPDIGAFEVR